jgi:Rieske 2Fe-2S family protein
VNEIQSVGGWCERSLVDGVVLDCEHGPMAGAMSDMAKSIRDTAAMRAPDAKTLPQTYFISDAVFATENERIFARNWLVVGHANDIPATGDYFLATVGRESVLIVRDQGDAIRAFHNVCRHRGARLCEADCGRVSSIQCSYHAWTYALDGRLIGAPHMDDVNGFEKADHGLHPIRVGLWEGLIFVNLDEDALPLDEWFAPLGHKFAEWNLSELRSARRVEYDVRANWKLVFQNYSECYHCPGVHPELSKVSPYDSVENDLSEGPFLGGFMKITKGSSLTMSGHACARLVGNIKAEDHHRVFYYSVFPNMLLSLHPDYVMVHQLWPKAPDRTLILCDWYFHPESESKAADGSDYTFNPNDAVEFWDMVNRQDWHVCELSQQGISSRAYRPGPYSSRESIPATWDDYYLRVMGAVKEWQ